MRIKTKLFIIMGISVFLISILLLSIFITSNILNTERKKNLEVIEIKSVVFELDILLNDYLLHREERALKQWGMRYDSGLLLFREVGSGSHEDLFEDILTYYLILEKLFREEVENYEYEQGLIEEGFEEKLSLFKELHKRKISRLLIASHSIMSLANMLEGESSDKLDFVGGLSIKIMLLIVVLSFVIIFIILMKILGDIIRPLSKLRTVVVNMGRGKFGDRVEVKTNDEIGELGIAFNQMVEYLKKTRRSEEQKIRALERFAKVAVGREKKMIELKKKLGTKNERK